MGSHRFNTMVAATAVLAATAMTQGSTGAAAETDIAKCNGHAVTIDGTNGDDTIDGTSGRDVIRTYKGDDVVKARGGNDVVCTDRGADTLIGGRGHDRLHGGPFKLIDYGPETGAKADRFVGGRGNDAIFGGGNPSNEPTVQPFLVTPDRVEFPAARGRITVTRNGTVTGRGVGSDRLFGIQRITGTKWADRITVRGDRIVAGGAGDDRIRVLEGKNDYQIDPQVAGQHGADRLDLSRSKHTIYEINGGTGRDHITGSSRRDLISDRFGSGVIRAGDGSDPIDATSRMTVRGQGGRDQLRIAVRSGRRGSIHGGAKWDRLGLTFGTRGKVRLDVSGDRLVVGKARSRVRQVEAFGLPAKRRDVTVIGDNRRNRVSTVVEKGHTVRARLRGGKDRFRVQTRVSEDTAGRVVVRGGPGADELNGGLGRDRMRFFGGRGNDALDGNIANDVLRGGPGRDFADGWRGSDLCRAEQKKRCER